MKLLEKFCVKLYNFPHIFKSEEMNIMLSPKVSDASKSLDSLPQQSTEMLLDKYKICFSEMVNVY